MVSELAGPTRSSRTTRRGGIVFASPNAAACVVNVAKAAAATREPIWFYTSFQALPWMTKVPYGLIPKVGPRVASWVRRRTLMGLPKGSIRTAAVRAELLRAGSAIFPRAQPIASRLMYRAKERFDRSTAAALERSSAAAFVGQYASAERTLATAKANGAVAALIFENSHPKVHNRILREMAGLSDGHQELVPPEVERRVERELEVADIVFAPSRWVYRQLQEKGIPLEKLALEPYGVDTSTFHPGSSVVTRRGKVNGFRCLYVGQIAHRKGIGVLLEAAHRLTSKRIEFLLIGPLVSPELLERTPENVVWQKTAGREVIAMAMRDADAFILPSLDDAYGLVATEAMASGLPVIVSDHTGAAELVSDSIDGLVIPSGNVRDLVEAIERLIDDEELRLRLAEAGPNRVERELRWEGYGRNVLSRIEDIGRFKGGDG